MSKPDQWDIRDVQKSGKGLTMQAVTLSSKHIRDGRIKSQFIRDVDRFEQCLVNDFENGRKTKGQVLSALKKEQYNLIEQGTLITKKGIGFVAGVMQTLGGVGICYASATTLCLIGGTMAAHGANNIYENGKYFIDGDENATGPVRGLYQAGAELLGYTESHGNLAYYGTDLALSAYGAFAKSTTVKNANEAYQITSKIGWQKSRSAQRFKLFRYSSEDYLRGYQASSRVSLITGAVSDGMTADSLNNELKK